MENERNEPLYKSVFEHCPDAIFIEDFEGTILDVNRAGCELQGLSSDEIIGHSLLEFVPEDRRDIVKAQIARCVDGSLTAIEGIRLNHAQKLIPVELRVSHIEHQGQPALMKVVRDISFRKDMETKLHQSDERFRRMVHHAPEAVVLFDQDTGRFVEVNPAAEKLFGFAREELLQLGPIDLSPPLQPNGQPSGPMAMDMLQRISNQETHEFEWMHCNRWGAEIPCKVSMIKLEMQGKTLVRGSMVDLRKHKEAERLEHELQHQLQRAKRMEISGILAGGVAHDLNNILGPMVGYPDLLHDEAPPDSPMQEALKEIKASAERAAEIIQDLLMVSRNRPLDLQPTDINEVVEAYLQSADFQTFFSEIEAVTLTTALTDQPAVVNGSQTHLQRVVMNLSLNALQAMPSGGQLHLATHVRQLDTPLEGFDTIPEGEYLVLTIQDSGEGISEDRFESIFEPFVSGSGPRSGKGSGLGLAVVYGVVRDHQGYIEIKSTLGQGTVFQIFLPRAHAQVSTSTDAPPQVEHTGTVLIVDDIRGQRNMAAKILTQLGYSPLTAANGHAALEVLRNQRVDLVLLDMIMEEGFDGLDTYREIHKLNPDLPCVIVSGFAASDRVKEALALGAGPYLAKPYSLNRLVQALAEVPANALHKPQI